VRRRIVFATLAVAVAGILVLGIPLAVAARRVVRNDALRRLDRQADAIGFAIDDDIEQGRPVEVSKLDHFVEGVRYIEVVDNAGRRTTAGRPVVGRSLTTAIALPDGVSVRVTEPVKATDERTVDAVALVASFGVAGLVAAGALALLVARRVSRPLDELAAVSRRLGAGDFSARVRHHGLAETDAVADALNEGAERIEQLVEAERQFSANASHQLRTPLTALRLRLEELSDSSDPGVRAEAMAALAQADRLETTIDDLLALARGGLPTGAEMVDIGAVAIERAAGWADAFAGAGRVLVVRAGGAVRSRVSSSALAQAVDALLDNALHHGEGTATIEATAHADYAEISVRDEGPGIAAGREQVIFERHVSLEGGTGVGLALARALVEAQGGRVDLVEARPPAFRILLPVSPP
jgi:signal transduction histidine kinase